MIVVTGGTGMVGKALRHLLPDALYLSQKDVDLRHRRAVTELFEKISIAEKFDTVVHLAARVGGIKDNAEHPYDYFTENAMINTNVIDACVKRCVPNLIAVSSTCVYPNQASSYPLRESMIHDSSPEPTNAGYAYAKRMMQVQIEAARKQFGLHYCVLYPSNLYGPHDTFDPQRSHLVAALIQKMHEAKTENRSPLNLLGTGRPLRQFTFVEDLAEVLVRLLNGSPRAGDYNVATPENLTVEQIARTVADTVGFRGTLEFNGELDGQYRKDVSSEKLLSVVGPLTFTPLAEGVKRTYDWYLRSEVPANV